MLCIRAWLIFNYFKPSVAFSITFKNPSTPTVTEDTKSASVATPSASIAIFDTSLAVFPVTYSENAAACSNHSLPKILNLHQLQRLQHP